MKKLFLIVLIIYGCLPSRAQLVVNLQFPLSGVMTKNQLWNLSIINTANESYNVQVEMILSDVSNSQRVLKGVSKFFSVAKGVKQVQTADVNPVIYSPGNPGYQVTSDPNGFLPIGVFNVCYTVVKIEGEGVERMTEECETIEVNPVSPPQLVLPADSEHVETNRPLFTWLPPAPITSFTGLVYELTLVEVLPTQTSGQAVQRNMSILRQRNLSTVSYQFPASIAGLDTSKVYAWRVAAKTGMNGVSSSEVWTFRLKKELAGSAASAASYFTKVTTDENSGVAFCKGILRFEYINDLNDKQIDVNIKDLSDNKRKTVSLDSSFQSVKFGQNLVEMNLMQNQYFKDKHFYLLELVNSRNEKRYLKFEYLNPEENQ